MDVHLFFDYIDRDYPVDSQEEMQYIDDDRSAVIQRQDHIVQDSIFSQEEELSQTHSMTYIFPFDFTSRHCCCCQ